ncbi:hypothetical protein Tco_0985404 [Tanacetum coccineum]
MNFKFISRWDTTSGGSIITFPKGLEDEGPGSDDECPGSEDEGPGSKEDEEVVASEGQQQVVPVVDTTADEPLECSMPIDPPLPCTDVLGDAIVDIDLLLGEHLDTLSTGDREVDFNPSRDIEELECLLADDPVQSPSRLKGGSNNNNNNNLRLIKVYWLCRLGTPECVSSSKSRGKITDVFRNKTTGFVRLEDEGPGSEDGVHGSEDDGLGSKEDEEVVASEGQQQVVPVVDTTADEPLGLGYGTLRRRELALGEGSVPSTFDIGQSSRTPPSIPRTPIQTPPSPEWSSGSLLVSPSSPIVPTLVASSVTTPIATIAVGGDEFLVVGAQLELHESILHDHTQRLDA